MFQSRLKSDCRMRNATPRPLERNALRTKGLITIEMLGENNHRSHFLKRQLTTVFSYSSFACCTDSAHNVVN